MAKVRTMQSALNSGELSPKLHGRPDLPRYASGLELCRNMIPLVTGGATRRAGTRHVASSPHRGWLIPFTTSLDGPLTGYIIELRTVMEDTCSLRFYTAAGQLMLDGAEVQAAVPYHPSEIPAIHHEEFEDVLYFFHKLYPPHRLVRVSDTSWTFEPVPITAFPFMRPTGTKDITITPSALTGDITLVASAAVFVAEHVGLKFQVNGGIVEVTAVTDSTHASAHVVNAIVPAEGVVKMTATISISTIDPPTGG